jgi:hypothetical protein
MHGGRLCRLLLLLLKSVGSGFHCKITCAIQDVPAVQDYCCSTLSRLCEECGYPHDGLSALGTHQLSATRAGESVVLGPLHHVCCRPKNPLFAIFAHSAGAAMPHAPFRGAGIRLAGRMKCVEMLILPLLFDGRNI